MARGGTKGRHRRRNKGISIMSLHPLQAGENLLRHVSGDSGGAAAGIEGAFNKAKNVATSPFRGIQDVAQKGANGLENLRRLPERTEQRFEAPFRHVADTIRQFPHTVENNVRDGVSKVTNAPFNAISDLSLKLRPFGGG